MQGWQRAASPFNEGQNTWNMSVEQLLHAAAGGGKASEYFKSGTKGWDYHQYLMLFIMLTPTEKKIIRMNTADREQCVADERL